MNINVITAIFKRNLTGYFSSPIGYVFICVFVLLSGFAAFWPDEFFNANLATLDQLNQHLPWILLVFIPAITMSLWADERRQGTDELLLTLPCKDMDVVMGKYLAAVAIYTVALIFSLSNIVVLKGLGQPDAGLLLGNYVGYWLVGAAMIAIGMVASFLTNSLTVGFILGLIFNAPLVFAGEMGTEDWGVGGTVGTAGGANADSRGPIVEGLNHVLAALGNFVRAAGIGEQFRDFGRGLMTLSGVVFFLAIVVVCLYLSMVLIGRRHWASGRMGRTMAGHFLVRAVSIVAMVIGVNALAARFDQRLDVSAEKINSLSPQTIAMLKGLQTAGDRPVVVEAYISPQVPEEYVQTRMNLTAILRDAAAMAGNKVVVKIHDTQRFSEAEAQAAQQFGIHPRPVQSTTGGKMAIDQIVLGAAFSCGLDKVVVPFFDRGTPVEYEVVRSIATVGQQKRKRIGVVGTDVKLFGGFDMESFTQRPSQQIIEELQKQYELVQVNAEQPITERFDALLAVQPSTLSPAGMDNFVAAVKTGQPTAIYEDPLPFLDSGIAGTSQPRTPPRKNPFQQPPPPQPKGEISKLWSLLGVSFGGGNAQSILWQTYNPYPKVSDFNKIPEFVFIAKGSGAAEPFNEANPITKGLQQIVTLFPAGIEAAPPSGTGAAGLKFEPLLQTSTQSGFVAFDDVLQRDFFGRTNINPNRRFQVDSRPHVIAARISSQRSDQMPPADSGAPKTDTTASINVVLVGDIDMLASAFFAIRARGTDRNDPVRFDFDNVSFILNTLDYLAGDDRFIDLRNRRPAYRTLITIERQTEKAKAEANKNREAFVSQFEAKRQEEQKNLDDKLAALRARKDVDPQQAMNEIATMQQAGQNRLTVAVERLEKQRDQEIENIERKLALEVRGVQNKYKLAAVIFPSIPPLLFGAYVFMRRRSMEKIGVPKSRMR